MRVANDWRQKEQRVLLHQEILLYLINRNMRFTFHLIVVYGLSTKNPSQSFCIVAKILDFCGREGQIFNPSNIEGGLSAPI